MDKGGVEANDRSFFRARVIHQCRAVLNGVHCAPASINFKMTDGLTAMTLSSVVDRRPRKTMGSSRSEIAVKTTRESNLPQ